MRPLPCSSRGVPRWASQTVIVDPTLDGQNQAKFAGKVRYSFPSKHAVISAAEVAVLAAANPADRDEYLAMQAQIDYSRLYAGGHYASAIIRGAFLGQLTGDYAAATLGPSHPAAN